MKRIIAKGLLALASLLLAACAFKGNSYPNTDQTNETWPAYVHTNSNSWVKGSSRWFMTGDPNATEEENMSAPLQTAMSTMMVRVPDFNKIKVDGPFQVELFGTSEANSVYLYGPNDEVREIAIEVHGDTLYIHVTNKKGVGKLCHAIVRVGVANLNHLTQLGSGRIEGRQLHSTGLEIDSYGSGNIYLAGGVTLRRIMQNGNGNISVFGAYAPSLDIVTTRAGGVNVSGNIALHSIKHAGRNDINIVGANGGCATICTEGCGKIGISGNVNIRQITSKDETCVYAYCVRSGSLYVQAIGKSRVGLAGSTQELYVSTSGSAQFYGRDLSVGSAYARSNGSSHINVAASNKIYASSSSNGSVYFFGSPSMLSEYQSGNGTVISIWNDRQAHFPLCRIPVACYKDTYKDRSCVAPVRKVVVRKPAPKKTGWQCKH